MRILICAAAGLVVNTGLGYAVAPNSVTIKTYSASGVLENTSKTFSDGIGRKIQSQLEDGTTDIISGSEWDKFNRPVVRVKPVPSTTAGHLFYAGSLSALANSYYDGTTGKGPASGGKAYFETSFQPNPLNRMASEGAPGSAFSLSSGHAVKKWYFGRAAITFVSAPTDVALDALANEANAKYFLEVFKDANGGYVQTIKDLNGNVVRTWGNAGSTSSGIIEAVNFPDFVGHVLKSLAPGEVNSSDAAYSYFEVTATGQILSTDTPDEGMIQMAYSHTGELRFIRNEIDLLPPINGNRMRTIKYDRLGRQTEISIFSWTVGSDYFNDWNSDSPDFPNNPSPTGSSFKVKIRNYYDFTTKASLDLGTPAFILSSMNNLRGKLVAVVSFDESGDLKSKSHRVEEYFSYDRDGLLEKKHKIIPGLPVQRFSYTYDLQGKLKTKTYSSLNSSGTATFTDTWTYQYDARGRLLNILANNVALVTYQYNVLGQLIGKKLKKDAKSVVDEVFTYNVRDWLLTHRTNTPTSGIYNETLTYESAGTGTPRYDGTISTAAHAYVNSGTTYSHFYKYDNAGQLVSTTGTAGYNETFAYDAKGRITQKNESNRSYGPYNYTPGTHRVRSVPGSPMTGTYDNYVYDPKGNMVLDRSKKMIINYDWRNLPVTFKFYKSLPARALVWSELADISSTDGSVKSTEVQMMYDAQGQRVSKRTFSF